MKTVTIRQVHNDFRVVLARVAQGEEVTVLNWTRPVARAKVIAARRYNHVHVAGHPMNKL